MFYREIGLPMHGSGTALLLSHRIDPFLRYARGKDFNELLTVAMPTTCSRFNGTYNVRV